MTAQRRRGRGRGRAGKGVLPPNPRQWEAEHRGLDLRDELGLGYEDRLVVRDAFARMPEASIWAVSDIPAAGCYIEHLRGQGASEWSGAAVPMPDGKVWVVYNDAHPRTRIRATLMEEFFHLRLGHPPSIVRVYVDGGPRRSFDAAVESDAYAAGAAALVSYYALCQGIGRGETVDAIAENLEVSSALVEYRLKVTRLWARRARRARKAS